MRHFASLAFLFFTFFGTFAQTDVHQCASSHAMDALLVNSPEDARSFAAVQEALRRLQAEQAQQRGNLEVHTIPVVVHVLHLGSEVGVDENISDEQIVSAIDALNEDYRRMVGTNGEGDGVDTFIQFELAKRDPDGNPTNGITRMNASGIAGYADDGVASDSSQPGASELDVKTPVAWDRDDYINFYIVHKINGGNGVNGYAYPFRTFNPILDGVVQRFDTFGTVGNLKPGYINRTTTHEVGHHLRLLHTFENTLSCEDEANCSLNGDQVCDTPPTTLNRFCDEPTCDDALVQNYMDYTGQTCRNMFTAGQRDRMRACLEGERKSLTESLGAMPVVDEDLVVKAVNSPGETTCQPSASPSIQVLNQGVLPANGFQLSYVLNGGTRFQNVFNQTIDAGESINVSLPELALTTGTNELEVVVKQLGGGNDEFPENDTLMHPMELVESDYWTLNLTTGFFASETSWTLVGESGDVVWSENDYSAGINDYIYEGCMTTGCYTLTFFDAGGDGMKFGGSMVLTNGAGDVIAEITEDENEFGSEISFEICATVAETAGCIDANGNGMCDDAEIAGCLDINACNFNSQAIMDGGNCTYPEGLLDCEGNCIDDADGDGVCDANETEGCTAANACNYNPSATDDDNSCEFPAETYLNCAGSCINDTDGDGICNELEVAGCTDASACNYNPDATDAGTCDYAEAHHDCQDNCINDADEDGVCDELEIVGCTNSQACNYDPAATDAGNCEYAPDHYDCQGACNNDADGDGVCDELEVAGCSDTGACNYVANATDEEACIYASEHYDCAGNCIDDEDGDGVCDQLEIPGCTALAAQNYDPLATDDDGSCTFSLEGCMDSEACNFNPIANTDTGGCIYAETHHDCNGNCLNDTDGDGVCDELETVGCTDETACNYDANATGEGDCSYAATYLDCNGACINDEDGDGVCDEFEVVGCTDVDACNYDDGATDDGACEYPEPMFDCDGNCLNDADGDGICDEVAIAGCMDDTACNYNAEAEEDDGSCEYPAEGYDCDGNTVSVGSIDAVPNLSLFPNPMNADHAMVYLSGLPDEQTVIRVIASDGRVAWEGTGIVTNPGVVGYPIRESVTQGTYFIQVGSSTPFGSIPLMVW